MTSAFWIDDSRCAIAIVVRFLAAWSSAVWTTFSDSESSAEVASSSKRILGSLTSARAIAIRSFEKTKRQFLEEKKKKKSPPFLKLTFLSSRQLSSFASDLGVVAVRERHDEIVNVCLFARAHDLVLGHLLGGHVRAKRDVEPDRAGVQRRLLRDERDRAAVRLHIQRRDVLAVDNDTASEGVAVGSYGANSVSNFVPISR